jgi:hypothetical protein
MSAQIIYDHVPLGSLVCYSDGTLRPPERFKRKLAAWENSNNGGRLVRKVAARTVGTYTNLRASRCTRATSAAPALWCSRCSRRFRSIRR